MSRNPRSTIQCRPPSSASMRNRPIGHSTVEACGATATIPQGSSCRPRFSRPQIIAAKSTIPKRGPPPAPPKRVDYRRPQMTRAMEQRLRHTQRFREQMERCERERVQAAAPPRRPRRQTASPICGDNRLGRNPRQPSEDRGRCIVSRPRSGPCPEAPATSCPRPTTPSGPAAAQPPARAASRAASMGTRPRSRTPAGVPARTLNLAKSFNADVVKAEPLESGPIDNLIIPPGAINSEKATVISIPQPENRLPSSTLAPHPAFAEQKMNRSLQAICETLDEQDAAEAAAVNLKLQDLQQARRDFVMAVVNVSGNVINLQDDDCPNLTPITEVTPPSFLLTSELSNPRLIPCPDLDDPYLQVEYGRHHPVVEEAREYLRRRETERYVGEDFNRISRQPVRQNDFIEQEYLEIDEEADRDDCAQYTAIPRRFEPYPYLPMQVERLERFFDIQNFPLPQAPPTPPHVAARAPLGRECLPPDLWDVEDPWYYELEKPDLIDWNDC